MPSEKKVCQNCKSEFIIEDEDFQFYKKIDVPPPTFCPECRMKRRMMWRNEGSLYHRKCELCGKSIITVYASEPGYKVYCRECWSSDRWDPLEYGREYAPEKFFFEQFADLFGEIPLVIADIKGVVENSEYGNYNGNCKNCYLCFSVAASENALYCNYSHELKECMDCMGARGGELCYETIDSEKNYACKYIDHTRESADSAFLFGAVNARNCFMSANIRNASYIFRGIPLDPDTYKKKIAEIDFGDFRTISELKDEFEILKKTAIRKYAEVKNSIMATGNNITNSKNISNSFDVNDSQNVKHSLRILKDCRDVYDCHGMVYGELVYEGFGCGFSPKKNLFSFSIDAGTNLTYCAMCHGCSDCFGCVGLHNKEYCILNRQYTKEEYEALVPKIIARMNETPYINTRGRMYGYGEFFPEELSPFAYNETIAQDYFSISEKEAVANGFRWKTGEKKEYSVTKSFSEIPSNIKNVDDSILKEIISCEHGGNCDERCSTAFRITPQELQLYRKMNVPVPHLCSSCRHFARLRKRNPLKLWHRKCMKSGCTNEFETSYAPGRPEIVYCDQCYQEEVV